ncbi:MAG: SET domain-containing protein, partial [Sandaracinaceae bacterium]
QRLSPDQVRRIGRAVAPVVEKYTFRNRHGEYVLCWDHGRFINHSCAAISLSPGVDFELAVTDVEPGQEITGDYGALNIDEPFECLCGVPECRGTIFPNDFDRMVPTWDAKLQSAVEHSNEVVQPLLSLIRRPSLLKRWAERPHLLPSAMLHRMERLNGAPATLSA